MQIDSFLITRVVQVMRMILKRMAIVTNFTIINTTHVNTLPIESVQNLFDLYTIPFIKQGKLAENSLFISSQITILQLTVCV